MRKYRWIVGALLILCMACATAPIDKAKQAGLASKMSCETSFKLIVDAHKLGVVSDSDYANADKLYDQYFVVQTEYATALQLWEGGLAPGTAAPSLEQLATIMRQLSDMVEKYALKEDK